MTRREKLLAACEFDTSSHGINIKDCLRGGAALKENARLLPLVTALIDRVEQLEGALAFYSAQENWEHGVAYSQNNLMNESDLYLHKGEYFYAGKSARAALNGPSPLDPWLKEGE